MNRTVTTLDFLKNVFHDAHNMLNEHGSVNITYEKTSKMKTKKQLGFFFGGLAGVIKRWKREYVGEEMTTDEIKTSLYRECAPKTDRIDLRGNPYVHTLTIKQMDRKQLSEFIQDVIEHIDNDLEGCILTPDLRYSWTQSVTKADIDEARYESRRWKKEDPAYRSYQGKQACINCGKFGCHAHHVRDAKDSGTGIKPPDCYTIATCPGCHKFLHDHGDESFYNSLSTLLNGLHIKDFCLINYSKYYNKRY